MPLWITPKRVQLRPRHRRIVPCKPAPQTITVSQTCTATCTAVAPTIVQTIFVTAYCESICSVVPPSMVVTAITLPGEPAENSGVTEMLTYADAIDRLVNWFGGAPDDRDQRLIRRAVIDGYREFCQAHNWRYFIRKHRVKLEGPYSTGTVAYTSSTRTLTLASGTWPTWAATGEVLIGSLIYEVESRSSSTALILHEENCPADDIASGTSYVLFKSSYILPFTFVGLHRPVGPPSSYYQCYVEPEEWFAQERVLHDSNTPFQWTILGSRKKSEVGRMALCVRPYPTEDTTIDFLMRTGPVPIRRTGFETASTAGTVSVSAASRAVTGVSTSFSQSMVGAVLRLSENSSDEADGLGSITPYAEEHVIESVTDTSNLVLATATTYAYSGVKYRIADALHLERTMYEVMLRRAEYQLAISTQMKASVVANCRAIYLEELRLAMENDLRINPTTDSGPVGSDSYDDGFQLGRDYTVTFGDD